VLGAVIQASSDFTAISAPSRVAIALAFHTLAVSTASLANTWAASGTVDATPSILTGANSLEALSMTRAVVRTSLLRAVESLVAFVALAHHLSSDWFALTVARA